MFVYTNLLITVPTMKREVIKGKYQFKARGNFYSTIKPFLGGKETIGLLLTSLLFDSHLCANADVVKTGGLKSVNNNIGPNYIAPDSQSNSHSIYTVLEPSFEPFISQTPTCFKHAAGQS